MSLDHEVRSLREVPMFSGLEPARLKLLAFSSDRVSFAIGEVLFKQGGRSDGAYIILDGSADVTVSAGDKEIVVASVSRNALIGEMGILTDAPRSASVTATSDLSALRIRKDVFFDLAREFPGVAVAVMRELARRLERTNALLAEMRTGHG